jgi:hypothetical protein
MSVPFINIIDNFIGSCSTMYKNQVFLDPGNQVILEDTLDELV